MNQSKYQTIADELKSRILSGEYKENMAIPPELQLQKDYQVSRTHDPPSDCLACE